jgi:hypothetical protein
MLVSQHAAQVLKLRREWHPEDVTPTVYADPSTGAQIGLAKFGQPASVKTEYGEHGIRLIGGNNDRAAGYSRLLELLHVEAGRLAPSWAGVPESSGGSPRLFVFRSCRSLIEQFRSAPVAAEGLGAGVRVDPKWESAHGHAIASARYGAMSWSLPAKRPEEDEPKPDLRAERAALLTAIRQQARGRVRSRWDETEAI